MIKRMDKEILAKYHQGRLIVRKYHQGRLYYNALGWLSPEARQAIMVAFGATDGAAVIAATNAYLNALAAQGAAGQSKATALAGFINEDPMMVCSLGLEPDLTVLPAMPWRCIKNNGSAYGVMPEKAETFPLEIEGYWMMHNLSGEKDYFGNWNNGGFEIGYVGALGMYANSWWTPHNIVVDRMYNVKVTCTDTKKTQTLDGDYKETTTNNRITSSAYPGLMAGRDNGYSTTNMTAAFFKIKMNGRDYWLVPFKNNGVMEWRDLNTGDYLSKVGTYTETYGYMLNGSWVTWTPSTP